MTEDIERRAGRSAVAVAVAAMVRSGLTALRCLSPWHRFESGTWTEIGRGTSIGAGAVLGHYARIGRNVTVGRDVTVGDYSTIGAGSRVGSGTVFGSHARIGENVTLGERVRLGTYTRVQDGVRIPDGAVLGDNDLITPSCVIRNRTGGLSVSHGPGADTEVRAMFGRFVIPAGAVDHHEEVERMIEDHQWGCSDALERFRV